LSPGWTQVSRASVQHAVGAALLLAVSLLPACSNVALPQEDMPASGADPTYTKLVANHIRTTFKAYTAYEAYEISGPRWVHAIRGWSWLACVRFQDHGRQRTYAMFIKNGAVVDSRYAVRTDDCDLQAYAPFDPSSGAMQPMSIGTQQPIY
jgi:hypothetical protein